MGKFSAQSLLILGIMANDTLVLKHQAIRVNIKCIRPISYEMLHSQWPTLAYKLDKLERPFREYPPQ